MKPLLLCLLLLWPTSLLAQVGQLGTPLEIQLALPEPGMQLRGLPDLGGLRLLEPSRISADRCSLKLLPLRPGEQTLPPLSFLTPDHRLWQSQPRSLTIEEPSEVSGEPAALKTFPEPQTPSPNWLPWLGLLLLPLLLLLRRRPPAEPEPATDSDRLKELADQIQGLEGDSATQLRRHCQQLRFAPAEPTATEIATLAAEVRKLVATSGGSR